MTTPQVDDVQRDSPFGLFPCQNWTPLDLIGASHFLISAPTNCARYFGDLRSEPTRSDPTLLSRSCIDGMSMAAIVAL